jgi:hypothetical protein
VDGWTEREGKGGVRVGFINTNDMYNNDVGKGVVYAYEAYEAKNKRQKLRCLLLRRKKKTIFLFIYEVITWGKRKKGSEQYC